DGQDVEFFYGFYRQDGPGGTWRRHGGHVVAIKKITKCVKNGMTTWQITFVHDGRQSQVGGVTCVTAPLTQMSIDLDNDAANETAWTMVSGPFNAVTTRVLEGFVAECPTHAAVWSAATKLLNEYNTAVADARASGGIDLAESKDILKRLKKIKALAK